MLSIRICFSFLPVLFVSLVVAQKQSVVFKIDTATSFQTIHNFGASDAWSIPFVGTWESREQIAELLFSKELDASGDPKGIGLSAWRYNIGAGSAELPDQGQIRDPWRVGSCPLRADGSYDWDSQSAQLWFLKEANRYEVKDLIGFVNSPPVHLTRNGQAWSADGSGANLSPEKYADFAMFLADVVKGVKKHAGVNFDYISPFNEPQWKWKCCKQEGSPWNNDELAQATRTIDSVFTARDIPSKLEITEAAQLDFLYDDQREPLSRNNQIHAFFHPASPHYLGDLKTIAPKVAGHSYFSTWNGHELVSKRAKVVEKIQEVDPNLEFWMTEYCILEDNPVIKGGGRDLGIDAALYIARVIQADLLFANASAWHWWLAVSPYDYKDGLVYVDRKSQEVFESKMLWTLGQFSRFIPPGSKRLHLSRGDGSPQADHVDDVIASAFLTPSGEKILLVVNQTDQVTMIEVEGMDKSTKYQLFRTSVDEDCHKVADGKKLKGLKLSARSISTIILD